MVESQTSVKPHYVTVSKNGKVTCEDCPGWKASKICAHAVAAAEKSGTISKYLKWVREKGPARMNITALVTCDSSSGTGQKRCKKSTSQRKGSRAEKQPPITTTVDRPALISSVSTQIRSTTTTHPQPPPPVTPVPPPSTHQQSAAYLGDSEAANFSIGLLRLCPHLVQSCFGCCQTLKPGGNIAEPPYDLVIISQMNRCFRTPNGEFMSRKGNVYFHVNLNCVKMKQPYFLPQMTRLPPMLISHLTPTHFQFLRALGMQL